MGAPEQSQSKTSNQGGTLISGLREPAPGNLPGLSAQQRRPWWLKWVLLGLVPLVVGCFLIDWFYVRFLGYGAVLLVSTAEAEAAIAFAAFTEILWSATESQDIRAGQNQLLKDLWGMHNDLISRIAAVSGGNTVRGADSGFQPTPPATSEGRGRLDNVTQQGQPSGDKNPSSSKPPDNEQGDSE